MLVSKVSRSFKVLLFLKIVEMVVEVGMRGKLLFITFLSYITYLSVKASAWHYILDVPLLLTTSASVMVSNGHPTLSTTVNIHKVDKYM